MPQILGKICNDALNGKELAAFLLLDRRMGIAPDGRIFAYVSKP